MAFLPETHKLTGKKVNLRTPEDPDLPALQEVLNDPETMASLTPYFGTASWTSEMVRDRYAKFASQQKAGLSLTYAIELKASREVVGNCGFKNIDSQKNCAEFGIILHRSAWGSGVSQECFQLCLNYGFEQLKWQMIYCTTDQHNERMKGFFSKHSIPEADVTEEGYLRFELHHSAWSQIKESLVGTLTEL